MNFESFAEQHGLIIDSLIQDRWVRVPTTDHPHKKNGSYIWDGYTGAVQNWAVHERPIIFRNTEIYKLTVEEMRQREQKKKANAEKKKQKQIAASKRAKQFVKHSKKELHPYLVAKGFSNHNGERGYVNNDLLVVPMSVNNDLVGCQLIDAEGNKRFLSGQITKGAQLIMQSKEGGKQGIHIFCEGYATAMSIRRVLKKFKIPYEIHVCFSAANIEEIASYYKEGLVIADNDPVGLKIARKTGKLYWNSPVEGEDFNDFEIRLGWKVAGEQLIATGLLGAFD